jgi:hypothetical protein
MENLIKQRIIGPIIGIVSLFFINPILILARTSTLGARKNQIINWGKTHSRQLKRNVLPDKIKVEWICCQNLEVVFQDTSNSITEVTFPCSGLLFIIPL